MSTPTSESHGSSSPPDLSDLYQQATARAGQRERCLDSSALLDLVRDQLDAVTKRDAVLHLADCSDCSREFHAIRQHPHHAPAARKETSAPLPFNRNLHRWSTLAAAAGLLLTVAVAFWQSRLTPQPTSAPLRSTASIAGTKPAPGTVLAVPPQVLSWQAPNPSSESPAQVRLFNSEGDQLLNAPVVGASSLRLPLEVVERLSAGGRFLWTVDAAEHRIGPIWFEVSSEEASDPDAP